MLVGYARTSTIDQKAALEAQLRELEANGCDRQHIFQEQVSSVDRDKREQLEAALRFVRMGDTLVVTKLDRLARSVAHLNDIAEGLKLKGVALRILDLSVDTGSATGELVLNLIAGVAQFERRIMLERQREGIAKAKAEGKYKGRKPTARAKAEDVKKLAAEGMKKADIAAKLGIARASVYRALNSEVVCK